MSEVGKYPARLKWMYSSQNQMRKGFVRRSVSNWRFISEDSIDKRFYIKIRNFQIDYLFTFYGYFNKYLPSKTKRGG